MPRLFLHIRDGTLFVEDLEGQDFASLDNGRIEALLASREILSNRVRSGKPLGHSQFEIMDEAGNLLLQVPFRSALIPD